MHPPVQLTFTQLNNYLGTPLNAWIPQTYIINSYNIAPSTTPVLVVEPLILTSSITRSNSCPNSFLPLPSISLSSLSLQYTCTHTNLCQVMESYGVLIKPSLLCSVSNETDHFRRLLLKFIDAARSARSIRLDSTEEHLKFTTLHY